MARCQERQGGQGARDGGGWGWGWTLEPGVAQGRRSRRMSLFQGHPNRSTPSPSPRACPASTAPSQANKREQGSPPPPSQNCLNPGFSWLFFPTGGARANHSTFPSSTEWWASSSRLLPSGPGRGLPHWKNTAWKSVARAYCQAIGNARGPP